MKKIVLALGTGLGAGYSPFIPGTIGSLWGVILYLLIWAISPNFLSQAVVLIIIFGMGIWISGKCEEYLKVKDHHCIVIDEVAGFLVSVFFFPFSFRFLIIGFILFRLFDIAKPFKIDKIGKLPKGWGIMLDDLAAGVLANIVLRVIASMAGW